MSVLEVAAKFARSGMNELVLLERLSYPSSVELDGLGQMEFHCIPIDRGTRPAVARISVISDDAYYVLSSRKIAAYLARSTTANTITIATLCRVRRKR